MKIVKRDGRTVPFNPTKISEAVKGAAKEAQCVLPDSEFLLITQQVLKIIETKLAKEGADEITVEEVQDIVEKVLGKAPFKKHRGLKEAYVGYRKERTKVREFKSDLKNTIARITEEHDNSVTNFENNYSNKLFRIASESNKWYNLANMPKHLAKAHENGDIFYQDLDSYNLSLNSLYVPTKEALSTGFSIGYSTLRAPRRIETAGELSCKLIQTSQNDLYGEQCHPDFDNDLSLYVSLTRNQVEDELISYGLEGKALSEAVEKKVRNAVRQSMQSVIYSLNTTASKYASKVAATTINIGIPNDSDAALICELFLSEYEKGLGRGEQAIYPNIVFKVKKGVNAEKNDPYHYLYKLACRVAAKRMNPIFVNMDTDFNRDLLNDGCLYASMGDGSTMGCKVNAKGHGNIASVVINLPRIALASNGNEDAFFELLGERLDVARESLMHRYSAMKKLKVQDFPFVCKENLFEASKGLSPEDSIEPVLKSGTYTIGFIGLAEALVVLNDKHHGECEKSRMLAIKIVKAIRKYTDGLNRRTKLNWNCSAAPVSELGDKFMVQDKKIHGYIDGVTNKENYSVGFSIPADADIPIEKRIEIEAPFHKLCNGGHITYIQFDEYPTEDDIMQVLSYAYENTNIDTIGFDFNIRYCKSCGAYLQGNDTDCPSCNNTKIQSVSREYGYISFI